MARWRIWIFTAGIGACSFEPENATRFEPPAIYREWFAKTEGCSNRQGEFSRLSFFVVPGPAFTCASGECVAHWREDHTIFIAERYLDEELVVRHEMLHDLIGDTGHPDPPFITGCGLTWTSGPPSARLAGAVLP
jgi:hypothetical protein